MSTPELTADHIRADVAHVLGCAPEDIGPEDDLLERGLDSVRMMTLVERWRTAGATGVEFADLVERPELGAWVPLLRSAAESRTSGGAA